MERKLIEFVERSGENGYRKGSLDSQFYFLLIFIEYQILLKIKLLKNFADDPLPESPTTILWLYYLLAQHYDKLGLVQQALLYIDKAIQHTPTLIELYMIKAKIHKVVLFCFCGCAEYLKRTIVFLTLLVLIVFILL